MSLAAALALAVLAQGQGIYICSASERIEPGTWAILQSRFEDGAARLPSFHIRYVANPREVISQQMEWYELPRWNEHLAAPDTIGFSVPAARTDRKGLLKFTADGKSWAVAQEPGFIRELSNFGGSWVEFQGYSERNKFWKGSGWKVEAVDRSGRVRGATEIRMPGPDRVRQAYGRLKSDLARFEADPARHCEHYPPSVPEDYRTDESDISVSGSSGPA